jgi:O-antigen/teichoic acid export membrane protein
LRTALAYTIGQMTPRVVGFALLPLYTRVISPSQYGALGVLLSISVAASILFALGLDIAIFRRYFELESEHRRQAEFVQTTWRFLVIFPLGCALTLWAVAAPFLGRHGLVNRLDVLIALLGAALLVSASTLPLAVLRAQERVPGYLLLTAVTGLGTPLLVSLFVIVFDQGVRGWLVATAIANAAAFLAACAIVPWVPRSTFDATLLRGTLRFSLPFLPQALSHWALQLADRGVIAGIVTATQLGVYSLAANIATPVMVVLISINQALMPTYARARMNSRYAPEIREVVVLQFVAVISITLAACLLGAPAANLVAPGTFRGAAGLVTWIALGYGFLGLYYIPMNGATLGAGRGKYSWVGTAIGAAVNITLLVAFVPRYGIKAAAVASAAGYLVLLVANGVYAHHGDNSVRYDWRRIVPVSLLAGATFIASRATMTSSSVQQFCIGTAWLFAFLAVIVWLRVIPLGSRAAIARGRVRAPSA